MSYAYNHWRRAFRGPGREYCSGVLVWQLNDIWPAASWALVDVNMNRKPGFYVAKRALEKVVVGMERVVTREKNYMVTSYLDEKREVEIWGVNGHLEELDVVLQLKAFDIESGDEVPLPEEDREQEFKLLPNQSTELKKLAIPKAETTVMAAYLLNATTKGQLTRYVSWPEPLKYIHFSRTPEVTINISDDENEVTISAAAPVKGVTIGIPIEEGGEDAVFEDNFADLVPGESVILKLSGVCRRKLEARWLCDWESKNGFGL